VQYKAWYNFFLDVETLDLDIFGFDKKTHGFAGEGYALCLEK
jgi:hypothetical protein